MHYLCRQINKSIIILDLDPYPNILNFIAASLNGGTSWIGFNAPTAGSMVALAVACVALMVSAFVSGSETAFFALSQSDIDDIENEDKRAAVSRLLKEPERLLATILISNNFVNVSIVLLLNYALTQILVIASPVVNFVLQSVLLTFILLLFGEILPKLYSNEHRLKWAVFAVGGVGSLSHMLRPLTSLMTRSTVIVNRVVTKKEERLSLDDLSHALEITDVEEQKDKNMLEEILKFGGKTVSDVMTPRVDMTCVDWDMTFDQLLATVRESGYSRLPVYVDNQDNIKGIVYAKDLLPFVGKKDAAFKWQSLLRDAFFVPESRMIDDILEDFQKKKMHMAIVVDEYGGTQGVVTLEDVLEEIVGEINDEYDDDEKNYKRLSQDIYEFEGKTQLNDFYRITGLDDDEFADVDEDAETIAGLLLNIKHDFPQENELIEYGRCRFRVMAVERHRIEKVKVKILQDKPETKEE